MTYVTELLATERRSSIERWVREHAYGVPMPNGDTLCRVLGEYMFVVTLDDHSVAPHLVMHGYWEMWITMFLAKRVRPGWRCIDVGANFGYYTVLLAELVGEAGSVEAWEPSLDLMSRLEKTVELSGMGRRVSLRRAAAGDKSDMKTLRRMPNDYGGATVAEFDPATEAFQQTVEQQRIADFTGLTDIDFIKIDAEGMEPEIWAGLGERLPKAALIEWTPTKYKDPSAFLALLASQGYSLALVNQHGNLDEVTGPSMLLGIDGWRALFLERK